MNSPSSERVGLGERCLALAARLRQCRLPAIETNPRVVAFAQTWSGRITLILVFAVLMKLVSRDSTIAVHHLWLLMTAAATAVSLGGRYRRLVMAVCTGLAIAYYPIWFDYRSVHFAMRQEGVHVAAGPLRACTLVAWFALVAIAIHCARRYRDHPLWRHPLLALHLAYFIVLGLVASHLIHGMAQVVLWSFTTVFVAYFWYLAYAFLDQRRRNPQPVYFQLATFAPFFFHTVVPFGKNASDWRSTEAGSAQELAVTQLKALKLLVWALLLKDIVLWGFTTGAYETLGIQPFRITFQKFANGEDVSGLSGLLSIITNFPEQMLMLAITGHVLVAVARFAGFRLLRNTCRPLSARTIAEFWNRYFYYFKELLAHVYFYPTYVRCFKRHPRLRIAFATFVAAGVGNFMYHFMVNFANLDLAQLGLIEALRRTQTYAFYCLLLVTGIVVSQLRVRKPDAIAGWWRGQVLPSLGVVAFFTLLLVFDGPYRHLPLVLHLKFLLHVFGLS